jgi:cytochrome c-type biogenesis protein CcmF
MISDIGHFSLSAAILAAAGAMAASIAAIRLRSPAAWTAARWLLVLVAALFTVASGALLTAFLTDDFSFQYVARYSEEAMPVGYKIAAFWAGQPGSLLLWGSLLSVMCVLALPGLRRKAGATYPAAVAVMAVACGFFAVLMLSVQAADPFAPIEPGLAEAGPRGLNPLLQDPAMIMHPPLLFLGYAGFTIPFAMMIGVLIEGRTDNRWIGEIRRWVIASWVFLTAGIVLGAWWAYVELGWGGYWAWDPVENASLLPWLTATALMHSMIVQSHRGMFKFWNVSLIAMTFILCIFGTYLTRSGVIQSVHAFPESWLGKLFLFYIILLVGLSAGLIIWRRGRLKPEHPIESFISREGAFTLGNIILVLMMLVTLIGTIFPLLSVPFGQEITLKREFYDWGVAPIGLVLAFIMAHGPVLAFGRQAASKIVRDMRIPGVIAIIGMVAVGGVVLGDGERWSSFLTLLPTRLFGTFDDPAQATAFEESSSYVLVGIVTAIAAFIAVLGTCTVIVGFFRTVTARHRSTGENWLAAAIRLIDADKRRYGAQVAHLGLMLIIIGVAGSGLYRKEQVFVLERGVPTEVAGYSLTLESVEQVRGPNFGGIEAQVTVANPSGETFTLAPQKRYYNNWERQPNAEIALSSTLGRDVYLILDNWNPTGTAARLQLLVSPLVIWIWIGGIVIVLGGLYCMLPRLLPKTQAQPVRDAATSRGHARATADAGSPTQLEPASRSMTLDPETGR